MDYENAALDLLPKRLNAKALKGIEELRVRSGRQITCTLFGKELAVTDETVTESDINSIINVATNASFYSSSTALSEGYIAYNGLRIGVCGNAVMKENTPSGFKEITSLCIRIPHDCRGVLRHTAYELYKDGLCNTLIISPPGGGKTTALRELIREISNRGRRIAVADERSELSCGFDMGDTTDVIKNMPKLPAAISMLRSMNPEVIAFDEITRSADLNAIREIIGCGVKIVATAHGSDITSMRSREIYREMFDDKLFDAVISVQRIGQARMYDICRL